MVCLMLLLQVDWPDVVFLIEMKRRTEELAPDIVIPGYNNLEVRKSDVAGPHPGAGIAYYTRRCEAIQLISHTGPLNM